MTLEISARPVPLSLDSEGVARVGGTRVTLETVVDAFTRGATAEEIALQYPTVELSDVYSVLGYYLDQREEIEAYLGERSVKSDAIRSEIESRFDPAGIRDRLVSRSQRLGGRQFDNLRHTVLSLGGRLV
jgi:uncharacterized protein (DUF433 family)